MNSLYILILIICISLVYLLLSKKSNILYSNDTFKIPKNCSLKNNSLTVRPFMFRNLSNSFIPNDKLEWTFECVDKNKQLYQLKLDRHCMYINDKDVCLYELNPSDSMSENENCNKLCSLDKVLDNKPAFNINNTLFKIEKKDNNFVIKNNNEYICSSDNKIIISSSFDESCLWML